MLVGIDVDDVLADMNAALCSFHNERYGTSLTKEDFKDYDLWKTFGCEKEESNRRIVELYDSKQFREIKPMEYSVECIDVLVKKHELFVITSRFGTAVEETKIWLDKYFAGKFKELLFSKFYAQNGKRKTKADVCKEYNISAIIEDSPVYAKECADAGIQAYLFDSPWNRSMEKHPLITRVKSWKEIIDKM